MPTTGLTRAARARAALAAAGWEVDQPRSIGPRLAFEARQDDGHRVSFYAVEDGVELYGYTPEIKTAEARHVRPEPMKTAETVDPGEILCYECQGLGWCDVCEGDGWIDGERCPACWGKKVCPICRGRGELTIALLSPYQRRRYPELRSK